MFGCECEKMSQTEGLPSMETLARLELCGLSIKDRGLVCGDGDFRDVQVCRTLGGKCWGRHHGLWTSHQHLGTVPYEVLSYGLHGLHGLL